MAQQQQPPPQQQMASYRVVADTDGGYAYGSRHGAHYYPYRQTTALPSTTSATGDHRDGGMSSGRRDEPPTTAMATSTSSSTSSAHHGYRTAGDSNVPAPSASPYSYSYSRSSLYGSTSSSPYTLGGNLFAGSAVPAHLWTATAPAPTSSLVSSTTSTSTSTTTYSAPPDKSARDEEMGRQHQGTVGSHTYVDDIHARPYRSGGYPSSDMQLSGEIQRNDSIQRDLAHSYERDAFGHRATVQPAVAELGGANDQLMEIEEEASGSIPQRASHHHHVAPTLDGNAPSAPVTPAPAAEAPLNALAASHQHQDHTTPMELEQTRSRQPEDSYGTPPPSSVLERQPTSGDSVADTSMGQESLSSSAPPEKRPMGSVFAMAAEAGIGTGLEYVHGHAPAAQSSGGRPSPAPTSEPPTLRSSETLPAATVDVPKSTETTASPQPSGPGHHPNPAVPEQLAVATQPTPPPAAASQDAARLAEEQQQAAKAASVYRSQAYDSQSAWQESEGQAAYYPSMLSHGGVGGSVASSSGGYGYYYPHYPHHEQPPQHPPAPDYGSAQPRPESTPQFHPHPLVLQPTPPEAPPALSFDTTSSGQPTNSEPPADISKDAAAATTRPLDG